MALTPSQVDLLEDLHRKYDAQRFNDELMLRYYQGRQRVEQLGMAIPPQMRRFLVVTNWCRMVVDTINDRQQVRSLILPGEETDDAHLRRIWNANNLSAHLRMFNVDRMVYGRAFFSVGANEAAPDLPLIRVESPRQMVAQVDPRREVVTAAARFFGNNDADAGPTNVTLYEPNMTTHVARRPGGKWAEVSRNEHRLGAVPVIVHLNRRQSGEWEGESELSDLIPLVDAAARSLTNLQVAQEAHGVPRMWMTGVARGDFIDAEGNPIPQFEAYFDAIHTLSKEGARIGQLTAADLKNFETSMQIYRTEAALRTGFPGRYFGNNTTNPPAEGAIRADEANLTRSVEAQNDQVGMTVGWTAALALRVATGDWVPGNRVAVDWFDPATPTVAQREDALAKRRAVGVLSREGYWDELGWSEARKAKERAYFDAEASEGVLAQILKPGATNAPVGN